jgi:hypothetical protein
MYSKIPTLGPSLHDTADSFLYALRNYSGEKNAKLSMDLKLNHGEPPPTKDMDEFNATYSYVSCGVTLATGLSSQTPEDFVYKILCERNYADPKTIREAFVVFSDIDYIGGGNAICAYIRKNNLGTILETEARQNPNTGNFIRVWVWSPPHKSLDPRYRYMPVRGKPRVINENGLLIKRQEDPGKSDVGASPYDTRFEETRFENRTKSNVKEA